jgi:uncharacterized membrane protein YphA (DoxX/SURF4 family)
MKASFFFIVRLAIAALFIYSGAVKTANPGHFLAQIEAFHLVDYSAAYVIAHVLPMVELLSGCLLLSMKYTCAASSILILISAVFIGVLTILNATGTNLDCGCFGDLNMVRGYTSHVILDASIIVLLVIHIGRSAKIQRLLEQGD